MAGPYPCDNCNQEPAAATVSMIETGETQFLGPNCFPIFCLEVAKAALTPEQLAELLGPIFVLQAPSPSGGRGGRRKAQETPDTPEAPKAAQEPPAPQGEASAEEAAQG